nr:unnamed protein product [Callosobruchus chinensis]
MWQRCFSSYRSHLRRSAG